MRVDKLSFIFSEQVNNLYKNEIEKNYLIGTVYYNKKLICYLDSIFDEKEHRFYGIVEDGNLLAVIHCKETKSFLHINNIVVRNEYQGNGYGRLLMSFIIKKSQEKNIDISLDVDAKNIRAVSWYKDLGFKVVENNHIKVFNFEGGYESNIKIYDRHCYNKFGFSNASVNDIDFFLIEPNVFKYKGQSVLNLQDLYTFKEYINGFLVVDSSFLDDDVDLSFFYEKLVFRMVKNVA
ncbi:GNAT family N-acetyltransferase [Psychrobacter sp. T6-5]|uniref:GNAT family N-acetyltransferase n=1 Tax=Psychrobacter sp. T6-5 TaxID=3457451 RepID=UPI003FD41C59